MTKISPHATAPVAPADLDVSWSALQAGWSMPWNGRSELHLEGLPPRAPHRSSFFLRLLNLSHHPDGCLDDDGLSLRFLLPTEAGGPVRIPRTALPGVGAGEWLKFRVEIGAAQSPPQVLRAGAWGAATRRPALGGDISAQSTPGGVRFRFSRLAEPFASLSLSPYPPHRILPRTERTRLSRGQEGQIDWHGPLPPYLRLCVRTEPWSEVCSEILLGPFPRTPSHSGQHLD